MEQSPSGPEPTPLSVDWCERHFDDLSENVGNALVETLGVMRAHCPVAHSDQWGGYWIVTDYEDVVRVVQDWKTFSSARKGSRFHRRRRRSRHCP